MRHRSPKMVLGPFPEYIPGKFSHSIVTLSYKRHDGKNFAEKLGCQREGGGHRYTTARHRNGPTGKKIGVVKRNGLIFPLRQARPAGAATIIVDLVSSLQDYPDRLI